MLDVFNIPATNATSQIYYTMGSAWQTWQKPRGAKFIQIFAIGGGGGGGGGGASTGATTRSGGGGGGSAAYCRGFYPAFLLPDLLYIQVGAGGAGGNSNGPGSQGTVSHVSVAPSIAVSPGILSSGNTNGGSGGNAGASGNATGGTGGLIAVVPGNAILGGALGLGIIAVAGVNGQTGLTTAGNGSAAFTSNNLAMGGASGGFKNGTAGTFGNGGTNTGATVGVIANVNGGLQSGSAESGYASLSPFCSMSGAGGGGTAAVGGTGGNGGNGGYGSGGGGGGAGVTAGGRGGRGGDGLVIITTIL